MTSNRSYRNAIPQHIVREEIVKGIGTQFDPEYARIMLHMIDEDIEYKMQEKVDDTNRQSATDLRCESVYHDCTAGFSITAAPVQISLCSQPDSDVDTSESLPALVVFDSLDGLVHPGEENNRNLLYYEYAQIRLDGRVTGNGVRNVEVTFSEHESDYIRNEYGETELGQRYSIEAVRYKDHMRVRISDVNQIIQVILALPDASRFTYISISGEHCYIHNIRSEKEETEIGPDAIPRIAEEISYIKDCPQGDIPNIQVDGWRTDATPGIPVTNRLKLTFHSVSLPTARLVWHCPFVCLFSSGDGLVNGTDYHEYIVLRLNGENWESNEYSENTIQVETGKDFAGWDNWKTQNKQGLDWTVTIERKKNKLIIKSEKLGISICSTSVILNDSGPVYAALTGDQCAITDIHITEENP